MTPRLSVLVPGLLGYERVLAALDAWEAQTRRDAIEILILSPDAIPQERLAPGQRAVVVGQALLHDARIAGIAAAKADYIVLAEDHCLPDSRWVEAILPRLGQDWAALGPALRSANPKRAICAGSFLLGYGQWMAPVDSGPVQILPGHNVVLRRRDLEALGEDLPGLMIVSSFLVGRLRQMEKGLYLENLATMRHFDTPNWARSMRIFFYVGLGFGARRTATWNPAARAIYWMAAPLIALKHWQRGARSYYRAGREARMHPAALGAMAVLSVFWAIGEGCGAMAGTKRTARFASISELKAVTREEAADSGAAFATKVDPRSPRGV